MTNSADYITVELLVHTAVVSSIMVDNNAFTLDVSIGRATFSASGDSADVLKAFGDFQGLITPAEIQIPVDAELETEHEAEVPPPGRSHDSGKAADSSTEKVPLRVFLDSKKLPRGNAIVGLAIAIWAKRYANVNEIDADTAKAYWRDSGRKIPANISRDLGSAATEGWLERLPTKGQFSATSYGEKHFDELEATSK